MNKVYLTDFHHLGNVVIQTLTKQKPSKDQIRQIAQRQLEEMKTNEVISSINEYSCEEGEWINYEIYLESEKIIYVEIVEMGIEDINDLLGV